MANTLKDRVELVLRRVVILVTSMIMPLITGCGAYGPVPSGSLYVMNGRYYYQYYRAPVRYYYMPPVRQPVMTPYTFNPVQPEPAAPPDLPVSQPTESAARSQPSEPPSTRPRELVLTHSAPPSS
jgi:hypothetical protein